jgi:4-hydroxybenzoyl-CoA reductase subunit alpha
MEKGKTLNTTFLDYKMPSALDMPVSESICIETYERRAIWRKGGR